MKIFDNLKEYLARKKFDNTYRIAEVRGVFIPQICSYGWEGLDRGESPNTSFTDQTWLNEDAQVRNCGWETYEQANERLLRYIDCQEQKIPKIHKVAVEPKAWRILKQK